jgi:branched-chain amino acid transport system substrate-binding protein
VSFGPRSRGALLAALIALSCFSVLAAADSPTIEITAPLSLTGSASLYGLPVLDGARLAVEEANADGGSAGRIVLNAADDKGDVNLARDLARQVCRSPSLAVIGPNLTVTALTAGPVYADCGLLVVPPTAHGDDVPKAATTFQPVFNVGSMGSALAVYLKYVLKGERAVILYPKDGYGQPFADGFERATNALAIPFKAYAFDTDEERAEAIEAVERQPDRPAIALGMINVDAFPILTALRRAGMDQPVLAPSALGGEILVTQYGKEPEEIRRPGFFTDKVYAASPILFDSANADAGLRILVNLT